MRSSIKDLAMKLHWNPLSKRAREVAYFCGSHEPYACCLQVGEARRSDVCLADCFWCSLSSRFSSGPCLITYKSMMRSLHLMLKTLPILLRTCVVAAIQAEKAAIYWFMFQCPLLTSVNFLHFWAHWNYDSQNTQKGFLVLYPFALILTVYNWHEMPLIRLCSSNDGRLSAYFLYCDRHINFFAEDLDQFQNICFWENLSFDMHDPPL